MRNEEEHAKKVAEAAKEAAAKAQGKSDEVRHQENAERARLRVKYLSHLASDQRESQARFRDERYRG